MRTNLIQHRGQVATVRANQLLHDSIHRLAFKHAFDAEVTLNDLLEHSRRSFPSALICRKSSEAVEQVRNTFIRIELITV